MSAQEQLVEVDYGGGDVVSTEGGAVVVDLREFILRLTEELGLGADAAERIPESAGKIVIVESEELGLIQDVMEAFEAIALWVWALRPDRLPPL